MKGPGKNSIIDITGFKYVILILLLSIIEPVCTAQKPPEDHLKIHAKYFSEELFITTDRDLYACGEKVWFNIYKTDALTHMPEDESKVVYVDILDLDNNPVEQLKVETEGFKGSGEFLLPDTLRTGNYLLRSYTNWMQNFSKDLFAYKTITVINPFEKISDIKIPQSDRNPDSVIFFPEGGHLLSGLETRLGYRALDSNGDPVAMNGALIDADGDTLALVQTGKNGYGFSRFTSQAGNRTYIASALNHGQDRFFLPPSEAEGVVFSAAGNNDGSGILAKLTFSEGYDPEGKKLLLLIYSPGLSVIRKEINGIKNSKIIFSRNDMPSGISHLELKDDQQKIITDLWISNENVNRIQYSISPEIGSKSTRGKIRINFLAADSRGNPVESDFSVSVAKAVTVNSGKANEGEGRQLPGIMSAIEDCNLSDPRDYLIFFRPFNTIKSNRENPGLNFPEYTPELEGHLISGNIRDRVSGQPLKNENITLSFVGKTARCLFTRSDENGNFNFVTTEKGLQEIVIQPLTYTKECYVDLTNPFQSNFNNYDHGVFSLDSLRLGDINNVLVSMQISNIYKPFYQPYESRPEDMLRKNFYGKPDNSVNMSDYIELTSVREIVAELIPGVSTTRNNGKINFRVTRPYQTRPYENGPLVLVDGVPVYDLEKVIGINAADIEKVDVMLDRYYIAGNALDGIIHFISKKGKLTVMEPDKSVFRMEYDLLLPRGNFFSPDYSADSVKNNHLADFRNTLYWNPHLHTDINGKASVEFYSSDESMVYQITVEGITRDGRRGSSSAPLNLKE